MTVTMARERESWQRKEKKEESWWWWWWWKVRGEGAVAAPQRPAFYPPLVSAQPHSSEPSLRVTSKQEGESENERRVPCCSAAENASRRLHAPTARSRPRAAWPSTGDQRGTSPSGRPGRRSRSWRCARCSRPLGTPDTCGAPSACGVRSHTVAPPSSTPSMPSTRAVPRRPRRSWACRPCQRRPTPVRDARDRASARRGRRA